MKKHRIQWQYAATVHTIDPRAKKPQTVAATRVTYPEGCILRSEWSKAEAAARRHHAERVEVYPSQVTVTPIYSGADLASILYALAYVVPAE